MPELDLRLCRTCHGSGIDPGAQHRYTTGGHDDRSCPTCYGDGLELVERAEDE